MIIAYTCMCLSLQIYDIIFKGKAKQGLIYLPGGQFGMYIQFLRVMLGNTFCEKQN